MIFDSFKISTPWKAKTLNSPRYNWSYDEISTIYDFPLLDLVYRAATIHRNNFDPTKIQLSKLVSIKTGGCPEDCSYCPQAARYNTGIKRHNLMNIKNVLSTAQEAKTNGASRLCLGAAWREVKNGKDFDQVIEMVKGVCSLGMEVCCTLGMLNEAQASKLKEAGLYAYNHNLDTSQDHYKKIITTRSQNNRHETLKNVRSSGLTVCCGGIIGLGENKSDRINLILSLSKLTPHPESIPINTLVAVKGTPLENAPSVDDDLLIRMVATTRIVLPKSYVRLSAGRKKRSESTQALCFLAGANSIFVGDKLLTQENPSLQNDLDMLKKFGLSAQEPFIKDNSNTWDMRRQSVPC